MDYMREINAFERWLETNYLPCLSQLLWYHLMALCNRAGWPEWISVDNRRLMGLIQCEREATIIAIRNKLIDAGLMEFRKGKKGVPSQYRICTFTSVANSVANSVDITTVPTVPRKTKTENNTLLLAMFDEFWDAYPKKVSKKNAEKAYAKLKPDEQTQARILDAVNAAKNSDAWLRDNGQYIPHPATWLNGERWNDAILPDQGASQPSPAYNDWG